MHHKKLRVFRNLAINRDRRISTSQPEEFFFQLHTFGIFVKVFHMYKRYHLVFPQEDEVCNPHTHVLLSDDFLLTLNHDYQGNWHQTQVSILIYFCLAIIFQLIISMI